MFYSGNLTVREFEITYEEWETACMRVIGNEDYSFCFLAGFCRDTYTQNFGDILPFVIRLKLQSLRGYL